MISVPRRVVEAEALCIDCGLCCDGTFFDKVRIGSGLASVPHAAVEIGGDGEYWLRQPCSFLGEDGCHIYLNRPAPCRDFECLLLRALKGGEIDLPDAVALIQKTKEMLQRAKANRTLVARDPTVNEWLRFYFGQTHLER